MAGDVKGPSKTELVAEALSVHASEFRRFVCARAPAALVDDVLQTAAVRAVQRAESLNDPERVLAWLYRIYRNTITDVLRQQASRERLLDRTVTPPEVGVSADKDLCSCSLVQTQRLSPAYASVLTLVDVGDASLSQAAEVLGISANNATVRLHRARKALREAMLEHCGVESARDCIDCRCVFDGCCTA